MSIKISKIESKSNNEDNILHTKLYGDIMISKNQDSNFMYFDSIDNYDLFVNEDGSKLQAVLTEEHENKENSTQQLFNDIKSKFTDCQIVNIDKLDNSIIVKDNDNKLIYNMYTEYSNVNNKNKFNIIDINYIGEDMLYIKLNDSEVLDEGDALDKLSDQDIKNVIQKSGVKLNGNENKERLKGIMQGIILNNK